METKKTTNELKEALKLLLNAEVIYEDWATRVLEKIEEAEEERRIDELEKPMYVSAYGED